MRRLLYHIIACCTAVLFFAACDKECNIPGGSVVGDGNSIILDLSSETLPVSRAANTAATGAEVRVDHIDVLIFDGNGDKKHHERVGGSETGNGTIVLSAKRSSFDVNAKYEVHLIANSTADAAVFAADDFDMDKLKGLGQTDRDIHMTGYPGLDNVPQAFLMDGIAHLEGDAATQVVLNDGDKSNDTKLEVTLRRAAAKLVIKIKKGTDVVFNNAVGTRAGYYLRNMPYSTSVLTGVNADAALRTPDLTDNDYFKWTQDADDPENPNPDRPYTLITVTAYAYAHSWENESALEKETRLIVNIPMKTIRRNQSGEFLNENNEVVDSREEAAFDEHDNSYYQIPVCEGSALARNTCYEVSLTINVPGGTDPSKPVVLEPVSYEVRNWDEKTINIGGETNRPEYLTLNEYEFEMHNMDDDHTTLQFTSSSEVTAEITKVYYIDKFGQEQELTNISGDEWGVNTGTTNRPNWTNRSTIRITPDEGINGKIDVFGDVPENNAVRYIEFTVTNETGQSRSVTVAQYPLEYITNIQGWYSYREDFNTSWEVLNGISVPTSTYSAGRTRIQNRYVNTSWRNGQWNHTSTGNNGFFCSKVVTSTNQGRSNIYYFYWREQSSDNNYTYTRTTNGSTGFSNARMYHIQITASSEKYTLGKPRLTSEGITDPGADNNKLVSPSFMLASQLGTVLSITSFEGAADHCKQYVEVAEDGTVYNDWRLPTRAEVEIIMEFQYKQNAAMDEVLSRRGYWCADGENVTNSQGDAGTNYIRCIRDAYDDKKTSNQ